MATLATTQTIDFVINQSVSARIERAESRKNIFLLWLEGSNVPLIVNKQIVAEDGFMHKSQFAGLTVTATPTQATNGQLPGFLANVDLPLANLSTNSLLAYKQQAAARYQSASLYAVSAAEEV